MGFNKSWDVADIARQLRAAMSECSNPGNDGFTACYCKQDLYQIRCLIEDNWDHLPKFPDQERQWEQQRIIQRLKR
jgi:hypothetical protein